MIPTLKHARAMALLTLSIIASGCSNASRSGSAAADRTSDVGRLVALMADSLGVAGQAQMDRQTGELRITLPDYLVVRLDSVSRFDYARSVALFARAYYASPSSVSYIRVVFASPRDLGSVRPTKEAYEAGWRPAQLDTARVLKRPKK